MPKEQFQPCFQFTEREKLYDRVSHKRFLEIVQNPDIKVHEVKVSLNSFGEYLFVLLRCRADLPRTLLTFWELGYHEYRERWITEVTTP